MILIVSVDEMWIEPGRGGWPAERLLTSGSRRPTLCSIWLCCWLPDRCVDVRQAAGGVSFGLSDNLDLVPARAERLQLLLDRAWMKGAGLDMSAVRLLSLSPPCWRCWGQSLWQCRGHETVAGRTLVEAGEMPAS